MSTAVEEKKEAPAGQMMDFVEVLRDVIRAYAGEPWDSVVAAAEANAGGLRLVRSRYWSTADFRKECPLNSAWLRKVDGRAFLYLQNW